MEAGKRTTSDIFNKNRILEIPFFQRSYVWEKDNWERFLDDMRAVSEENKDYFLGSVIIKQKETPSDSQIGDVRSIIDGQQRLTTLTIFYKVLYDVLKRENAFDDIFKTYADKEGNRELIIRHNHYDREAYEAILSSQITKEIRKKNKGSKILECYNYFLNNENILLTINPQTILNKVYFVGIDLTKEEDEQQIFDTINSLGVSLTTAELLKNELYGRNDETFFNKTWKNTFEGEDKEYWSQSITAGRFKRENVDLLLQAFLTIESQAALEYIGTSSVFKNYKKFFKEKREADVGYDKTALINRLMVEAVRYRENIDPTFTQQAVSSNIERINQIIFGLNTTTIIPYLLYLVRTVEDENEVNRMVSLIENYLVRRLVCRETTKNYNYLFSSFIRNRIDNYDSLLSKLFSDNDSDKFPSDQDFKEGIAQSRLTNQQAKVFLYLLESSIRNNLKETTQLRGLDAYTLEHIMPKKWHSTWENDLSSEQSEQRDKLVLTLGNLTILTSSLNTAIKNAPWKIKKEGKSGKPGLYEYSRGIKIFDQTQYLQSDYWDEEKISHRSHFLAEKAIETWIYPKAKNLSKEAA